MKKSFFAILLILIVAKPIFSQLPIDEKTSRVVFSDVVELDGFTKDEIYSKAKVWIVSTLKSGDNMVELNESGSNQIIGTGNLIIPAEEIDLTKEIINLNFKFIVKCKDGKYKYSVENFTVTSKHTSHSLEDIPKHPLLHSQYPWKKRQARYESELIVAVKKNVDAMISNLGNYMQSQEDEW